MKPLRILLTIFVLFIGIVVYKDASAVEWQEKPVVCMQKGVLEAGQKERGEVLIAVGVQETTVPVWLPVSIYSNPITRTYTIVEYHPGYESYCLISYGQDWYINGAQL